MKKIFANLAILAMVFSPFSFAVPVQAETGIVYNSIPEPLEPNYPSQPFQAQQTSEFGDYVHLGGTARNLSEVSVTMVTWARYSEYSSDPRYTSASWTHPVTVNIYSNHLVNGVPDQLLATKTVNITIPWRPEGDASCPNTGYGDAFAWKAGDGQCYNGKAFNASFDLSDLNLVLPNDVIVTFAFDTQTYGTPIGVNGPYNSLNIAVPPADHVTVGSDVSTDKVFWNTSTESYYSNDVCGGNTLCEDTNWQEYGTVAMQIKATVPVVATCPTDTTQTLLETVPVDSHSSTPANSSVLTSGQKYLFVSSGTWDNVGINKADTEFASIDNWANYINGYDINPFHLGEGEFDLQLNNAFIDWGAYNSSHTYSYLYTGTGATVSLGVFDGDSTAPTPTPNTGWYGDNSGSLSVAIYSCVPVVTPPPVTPKDQCKNNGWKALGFKNQGQCVSSVVSHK